MGRSDRPPCCGSTSNAMTPAPRASSSRTTGRVTCPVCARVHRVVPLRLGERALCVACGTTLPGGGSKGSRGLCYTATALILAVPAVLFPVVSVDKFGAASASYLWTGAQALWNDGMPLLAVWVALCGIIIPLGLLVTLVLVSVTRLVAERAARAATPPGDADAAGLDPQSPFLWARLAHAFQHWSMPEVHVLAVLIAFIKIGVLVNVEPGAGLWFYAAMAVALLLAWRNTDLEAVLP